MSNMINRTAVEIGVSDVRVCENHFPKYPVIDMAATGRNIRRIMDSRGISVRELQKYLGLAAVQSIYRWFDGHSVPTIDNLYAMSELFCVPIDALIRGNRRYSCSDESAAMADRVVLYYKKIMEIHVA